MTEREDEMRNGLVLNKKVKGFGGKKFHFKNNGFGGLERSLNGIVRAQIPAFTLCR